MKRNISDMERIPCRFLGLVSLTFRRFAVSLLNSPYQT